MRETFTSGSPRGEWAASSRARPLSYSTGPPPPRPLVVSPSSTRARRAWQERRQGRDYNPRPRARRSGIGDPAQRRGRALRGAHLLATQPPGYPLAHAQTQPRPFSQSTPGNVRTDPIHPTSRDGGLLRIGTSPLLLHSFLVLLEDWPGKYLTSSQQDQSPSNGGNGIRP